MRRDGDSRSLRIARRADRRLYLSLGAAFLVMVLSVVALTPSASLRPELMVHPAFDCMECSDWIKYLNSHGFRVRAAPPAQRRDIHRELRLPPAFQGSVVTLVDGFVIVGFVPARQIHQLIRGELGRKVIGVAVTEGSTGPWKPMQMTQQGVTVFAVLPGGLLRPVKVYHRFAAVPRETSAPMGAPTVEAASILVEFEPVAGNRIRGGSHARVLLGRRQHA